MKFRVEVKGFPTETFGPDDKLPIKGDDGTTAPDPRPWDAERAWDCFKAMHKAARRRSSTPRFSASSRNRMNAFMPTIWWGQSERAMNSFRPPCAFRRMPDGAGERGVRPPGRRAGGKMTRRSSRP